MPRLLSKQQNMKYHVHKDKKTNSQKDMGYKSPLHPVWGNLKISTNNNF